MNYGVPYQGSKSKIAQQIISLIPTATNFYDLFAGGCAITHCAMLHNKWKNYIINDPFSLGTQLFVDCISGNAPGPKWVTREEFEAKKATDPYVAICWSFGNDCKTYIYGRDIEDTKRACFEAVVNLDFTLSDKIGIDLHYLENIPGITQRRLRLNNYTHIENLERYARIQSMEHLERLYGIMSKRSIEYLKLNYDQVDIKPDSIIYCDPPYIGTKEYTGEKFNHDKFYEWCRKQTELTFISEYQMPEDFICVSGFKRLDSMCANSVKKVTEKLFIPGHLIDKFNQTKTTLF